MMTMTMIQKKATMNNIYKVGESSIKFFGFENVCRNSLALRLRNFNVNCGRFTNGVGYPPMDYAVV